MADFAWLEGRWQGKLGTATTEIIYSSPSADEIMGMFRLVEGERTVMLEFLTLRQTAEGMEMRVRHFDPALAPMEKEDALLLRLVSYNDTEAVFENPVHTRPKTARYVRQDPNTHIARSLIINDKGEESTIEVTWHRLRDGAPAAVGAAPADPLAPLGPLVGRWRGQIKLVNGGTIEALNVWEWGNQRKTVHFRAYGVAEGRERLFYEGIYYWHPGQQKIVFREVSLNGGVNEGSVTPQGDTLHLAWTEYESGGPTEFREDLRLAGDHYTSRAQKKTAEGWEPATNENSFTREPAGSSQTATPGEEGPAGGGAGERVLRPFPGRPSVWCRTGITSGTFFCRRSAPPRTNNIEHLDSGLTKRSQRQGPLGSAD
ncbi:MAG: DUF6265 family protein [Candidatus Acidiferrales bacterium]